MPFQFKSIDIIDKFSGYGTVKNIQVNRDRRTGNCKGYGLVEFSAYTEAQGAINELHGTQLLGKIIQVNWAFVKPVSSAIGAGAVEAVQMPTMAGDMVTNTRRKYKRRTRKRRQYK